MHAQDKWLLLLLPILFLTCGCETTVVSKGSETGSAKTVDASISVRSTPSGALVLASNGTGSFRERHAMVLGTTPLRRFRQIPEAGMRICVSKCGCEEWQGVISPRNPNVQVTLKPLPGAHSADRKMFQKITVLPARVGIKKIGSKATGLEKSTKADKYRKTFLDQFSSTMAKCQQGTLGSLKMANSSLSSTLWSQFEKQMKNRCYERIPYYPNPIQLELSQSERTRLPAQDGYLLLLRAEGYYTGTAKKTAKVAIPIALTTAAAIVSVNSSPAFSQTSGNTTTQVHLYPVFGSTPTRDLTVVQEVLLDCATMEIKWAGQFQINDFCGNEKAIRALAKQAAELVPDEYIR